MECIYIYPIFTYFPWELELAEWVFKILEKKKPLVEKQINRKT